MKRFILTILILGCVQAFGLGFERIVSEAKVSGGFCLFARKAAASLYTDTNDFAGVLRAATDLQADIQRVSGIKPSLVHGPQQTGRNAVFIGTIGKSEIIDALVREGKIDGSKIAGQWESFLIQVVQKPLPGVDSALVIAGSDKRGTIYGVYEVSEQIGVSPWHWWADVPAKHHDAIYIKPGAFVQGPPAVKYRGIFLNDERPALGGWADEKFGGLNHGVYTNIFELLLRLRANYLWPAMWDNSFATDDPLNAKLADEYGIVMGTSHHEPMMRAWKEWERAGNRKGSWDYSKNDAKLHDFWREGITRTKNYEKIITLGMRGDGDEPMSETESVALLERIVADQRKMISEVINTNLATVPQVWALYKEVQGYYERGMRVPDDVTLLWCDDNWGNIRRLPTDDERKRAGGAGIYYHLDYVGGPRNYKWLNTVPLPKIWEQMNLSYQYGADRLWIVNVGDLKPVEIPMEFFLTFARNPDAWSKDSLDDYLRKWAEREFGPKYASDIADIMAKYAKYNGRRKPELLEPGTFSIENYDEADRVLAEWKAITDKAKKIYRKLPKAQQDAFYQLVLYPTEASAVVNQLYVAVAKNRLYASYNDPRANQFARQAHELFAYDAALSDYFNHTLAGGKWNHMMDQTHIGYTYWQQPRSNAMPEVIEVDDSMAARRIPDQQSQKKWRALTSATTKTDKGFVERDGYISIEAEHFTRKSDTATARWEILPDHGRTLSGMTIFPPTARSAMPPQDSPCLEYKLWLTNAGAAEVTLILSTSLNFVPDRDVRIAASFDNEAPQTFIIVPKGYTAGDGNRDWEESVKDSVRQVKFAHTVQATGEHVLKVWMVDPAVVLQKITVDCGGLKPSYLGPPESAHR